MTKKCWWNSTVTMNYSDKYTNDTQNQVAQKKTLYYRYGYDHLF